MKNFLKGFTILITLLLLTNCEKDTIEIVESKTNISVKRISSSEITSNRSILNELEKFIPKNGKSSIQEKSDFIYNEEYGFIIATDEATLIEKEGYNSYTFEILRTVKKDILENLVLSQKEDAPYKAYLVSYDLTEEELDLYLNGEEIDLDGKISFKEIEVDADLFIFTKGTPVNTCPPGSCCVIENGIDEPTGFPICYYVEVPCDSGGNNSDTGGDEDPDGDLGTTDNGSSNTNNNDNGDETGLGGSATGGSPNSTPQEEVVTSPTGDGREDTTEFDRFNANRIAALGLRLTTNQTDLLIADSNLYGEVVDLLDLNSSTSESKRWAEQAIGLEVILNSSHTVDYTNNHPEELNSCCPGPCCPDPAIYGQDPIIQEYGIKPVQASVDATFNLIVATTEIIGSDAWVGKRIRSLMVKLGVNLPDDVEDEYLAAIFQVRKRDGIVIVEYRPGLLMSMLSVGLDTLDMFSFLSPSQGGGAFLAARAGGIVTITNITNHIRKISITTQKIDDVINSLQNNANFVLDGTGQFSIVRGHHPLAKIAFSGDKFYDLQKAFSVSATSLDNAWKTVSSGVPQNLHSKITGQQNSLYTAFAQTGDVLTLNRMAQIEIQAMVNVGIPENIATGWVIKALGDIGEQGVKMITNIPWNGLN